jgi:hypothetical protein
MTPETHDVARRYQRSTVLSPFEERLKRGGCRVRGAMRKEKGAFENTILFPGPL